MNKSQIRKIYQQKRADLTHDQIQEKSLAITNNFITNLLPEITDFKNKTLAFYVSANNEADPSFIIKHCQKLGNLISLPKIKSNPFAHEGIKAKSNSLVLEFKEYQIGHKLFNNQTYPKLLEPEISKKNIIPDIIFVP
jgi:5-formyltetrahydrofolate cyclo-ligase